MKFIEVYKNIGRNIKKTRKIKGLTQENLAAKSKVDRAKISDMENGKEDYKLSTLLQVCKALEITLEEISQDSNEESKKEE
jgi:transcriptional regulator with XRE-family HTH domain